MENKNLYGEEEIDNYVFKALEKLKEDFNKEREKTFNSKKGDTVNIIKKDGTEQIWRVVEIKKVILEVLNKK